MRYGDVVRKRNRIGRHVISGSIREKEVFACIISILLCCSSRGCGSITASAA
jgi:hypothetical protein